MCVPLVHSFPWCTAMAFLSNLLSGSRWKDRAAYIGWRRGQGKRRRIRLWHTSLQWLQGCHEGSEGKQMDEPVSRLTDATTPGLAGCVVVATNH